MTGPRAAYYPAGFAWGLAAVATAAVAGAFLCGGASWALGALAGAAAVALDFALLVAFAVAWFRAAERGGRGLLAWGLAALAAKALLPGAAVVAAAWTGAADVHALAFSALAVAVTAPALLILHLLRYAGGRRPVP
jgi:hypothetical protein